MKILVTGGSGLVGHGIQNCKSNHTIIFLSSKDCDLLSYNDTLALFKKEKPDCIIHLAGIVGGLFKNMNYKVDMLEGNLMINYNVLKSAHEANIQKVVSCLSTCIFPDQTTYPINEQMLHDGPPHFSNDAYAYAKRMLEIHSKAYQEQYGRDYVCVIPTNIYGPYDNFNLEDAHVIPALVHKCYLAKQKGEKFIVKGSGKPLRQFMHADDLGKLMLWTAENYNNRESIILSVGEKDEVSIGYVAKLIAQAFDYEENMEFEIVSSDGQYKKTADNSKLMELYGDYKFISIEDGIKGVVEWLKENYDECRK
jgi:GDP-L-fucose synthase